MVIFHSYVNVYQSVYVWPIFQAYFSREYPHNSYGLKNGTFTHLHQLDPEISIDIVSIETSSKLKPLIMGIL